MDTSSEIQPNSSPVIEDEGKPQTPAPASVNPAPNPTTTTAPPAHSSHVGRVIVAALVAINVLLALFVGWQLLYPN